MRMFYVPLLLPGKDSVPECFFAYKHSQGKFPHMLRLHKLAHDMGNVGMWNQWEFLVNLLSMGEEWGIAEVQATQQTVLQDVWATGTIQAEAPASIKAKGSTEPDFSFFEDRTLDMNYGLQFLDACHVPEIDESLELGDLFGDDIGARGEEVDADLLSDNEGDDEDERVAEPAVAEPGAAPAAGAAHAPHSVATDITLLQEVLGARCGPGWQQTQCCQEKDNHHMRQLLPCMESCIHILEAYTAN